MKGRIVLVPGILLVALLALGAYLALPGPSSSQPKSLPIPQGGDRNWGLTSAQIERARQLAMADRQVLTLLKGKRYQFIDALPTGQKFDGEMAVCAQHTCGQVEIYNFTDNATVSAIADLDAGRVFLVQETPNSYPNVNAELAEQAIRIARNDPQVLAQTKGCWTVSQTQTYPCPSGPMYHTGEGGPVLPVPLADSKLIGTQRLPYESP